jgi:hypothetical protein
VVTLAAAVPLVQRASLMRIGRGFSGLEIHVLPAVQAWRERVYPAGTRRGVVFGDSIVDWAGVRLGDLVSAELGSRKADTEFLTVNHPWLRPIQFYYLLDEVLAGKPAVAVVEVDLRAFWSGWVDAPALRAKGLARLLSVRRAWRIREVLAAEGSGMIDPFVLRMEERLGVLYLVDGVRSSGQSALERLGARINAGLSLPPPPPLRAGPLDVETARQWLDPDFARQRSAIVLRELLRGLREAGVVTILFVAPFDVDTMAGLGVLDERALAAKIEALRVAVGATPEEWRDLHGIVRSREFRDTTMHLLVPGAERVAERIGDALAPRLRAVR